jgi:hypothetical protein
MSATKEKPWPRDPSLGEFSVVQFFEDESYEYVRRGVSAEEAVKAAHHYTNSVGAKLGFTRRVIITDAGDSINFEWRYKQGVTFK